MLSMEGEPDWEPLLDTDAVEDWPTISRDGRWIAYTSTETGQSEVYVQRFPGLGGKTLAS